jgi:hypothetical protein
MKLIIEIDNLTEPQRLAIEDLLSMWVHLGEIGRSRWTAFYADGDGNLRPKITINGRKPEPCNLTDREKRWKTIRYEGNYGQHSQEMYLLDFDAIAWAMQKDKT